MTKIKDKNICIRVDRDGAQITRCKDRVKTMGSSLSTLSQILALAGNEVRLKILLLLQDEQKLCVCDLSEILEMKIPAISQHLRKLKDAGLVCTERKGTLINYMISSESKPNLSTILHLIPEPTHV